MPEEQQPPQSPPATSTAEVQPPKPKEENKITLKWVLFGIAAIIVLWVLSSLLFR